MHLNQNNLKQILDAVDISKLSGTAPGTLQDLRHVTQIEDQPLNTVELINPSQEAAVTVWQGRPDVESAVVDSGMYDEQLQKIPEKSRAELLDEITNLINWDSDAFHSYSTGNEVICEAAEQVFNDRGLL